MIITKVCADCGAAYEMSEVSDEAFMGDYMRNGVGMVWLCPHCRPFPIDKYGCVDIGELV